MDDLLVRTNVVIPADAFSMRAVRAGGPGGQNVNKVASKVELRVDLSLIRGLDDGARARLRTLVASSLDSEGFLLVTSQRTRDQRMNLEDAREKVRGFVERALVVPRKRRATKPTRGSVERRISEKKHHGEKKASRRSDY